jgi:hypothetical protein
MTGAAASPKAAKAGSQYFPFMFLLQRSFFGFVTFRLQRLDWIARHPEV